MGTEPRDPALSALCRATVRVETSARTGSGVVIRGPSGPRIATAAHIFFECDENPVVRKSGIRAEVSVAGRDPERDVVLLTTPPDLESAALELADDENAARPGDAIWGAGFPTGLHGTNPALASGAVATVGEQSWANLDGTWGNSGGPICRIINRTPVVVGLLLGRAGVAQDELTALTEDLRATSREMSRLRGIWVNMVARGNIEITNWDSPAFDAEEAAVQLANVVSDLATLLDTHFRTGFLRFAPVADLRKLLGTGDGAPSL